MCNREKMRIDTVLFKSLEFRNYLGHKVTITEIPVLVSENCACFMVNARLEMFVNEIYRKKEYKASYSFKEYLLSVLRWPEYKELFADELQHNA